jgi:hypothetical protein
MSTNKLSRLEGSNIELEKLLLNKKPTKIGGFVAFDYPLGVSSF